MAYFEIKNLRVTHRSFAGVRTVLDIEHLSIEKGETYGLVGESGQGKTVLALACGAEFLIADEPTRNLDVTIQASILKLLKELQQKHNMTVLFIANNLSLVSAFCDRVGILYGGKIIEENTAAALVEQPREEYTKVLIQAVRADARKTEPVDSDEVLLRIEHLKKYFDIHDDLRRQKHLTLKAVDDVSFRLKKGEVLGIVGESGCGKSTLVNTILNLFRPTEGKVYFEGEDVFDSARRGNNAFKKNVQIVFQDPLLVPESPVAHQGHRGRAHRRLREAGRGGTPETGGGAAGDGGHTRRRLIQISPRVFRRAAPAHCHRPVAGLQPEAGGAGRAHQLHRRVQSGTDFGPDQGPEKPLSADQHPDQPRFGRGPRAGQSDRYHVPGQNCGVWTRRSDFPPPLPSLHQGPV